MDEMEELQGLIEDLNTNQIFAAFVTLGAKFVNLGEGGAMTYNKTAHLTAFNAISAAYNQLAETEEEEDGKNLKSEIDQLTGENEP